MVQTDKDMSNDQTNGKLHYPYHLTCTWLYNDYYMTNLFYVFNNIGVDNSNLYSLDVGKNVGKFIKDDKSTVSGKFIIIITDGTMIYNLIYHCCV